MYINFILSSRLIVFQSNRFAKGTLHSYYKLHPLIETNNIMSQSNLFRTFSIYYDFSD